MSAPRIPDHLGLAVTAVVVAVGSLVMSFVVMPAGGRVWIAVGGPLCAGLAVIRSLIARMSALETGFDIRHKLGESARRLAIVSFVYAGGITILNVVTLLMLRG